MRRATLAPCLALVVLAGAGCVADRPGAGAERTAGAAAAIRPAEQRAGQTAEHRAEQTGELSQADFARLVAALSEPGRYFDTDNLISNESSYLHVIGGLVDRRAAGGAYIGVGPGQNFSYVAAVRPDIAFIIDIRRDNLLQHLWFKALFSESRSRLDYVCLMVARRCGGPSASITVDSLVATVDAAPAVPAPDSLFDRIVAVTERFGIPLSGEDRATIRSIHRRFADRGLDLRFNTHGRPPQWYYPTQRQLLLETDADGVRRGYLADEAAFGVVAGLQRGNRVVPVVGDLAGSHALRAIGGEIARRGLVVGALYTSNVEYYLFGDGSFDDFVANLAALPVGPSSVVIRSYFHRSRPVAQSVPGYASTQLLHTIPALLTEWREGRIRSYDQLIRLSDH